VIREGLLGNYLVDAWRFGEGAGVELVNPATREPLGRVSTFGLEFGSGLEASRQAGRELRRLTFAERAACLDRAVGVIKEERLRLLELSIANGGKTEKDAAIDVDGAFGTMKTRAKEGSSLGDRRWLLDGDVVPLSRDKVFGAQHAWIPRTGTAVLINADNFPIWGMAQKVAAAFLAGMPVVVKAAPETALAAHHLAKAWVEAGIFPVGTFSFIAGQAFDLIHWVGANDVVAFTGSANNGERVRQAVSGRCGKVIVEGGGLNAAVLAPDVDHESPTYRMMLAAVMEDMTVMAGQRCTATRRVLVRAGLARRFYDDLAERLMAETVMGNPALSEVTMGPVSSARRLDDIHAAINRLEVDASATVHQKPEQRGDGDGFFVGPTVFLVNNTLEDQAVHRIEVFGPVVSVMSYDSPDQIPLIVNRGRGSLVTPVYTDDVMAHRDWIRGLFDQAGRTYVVGAEDQSNAVPSAITYPGVIHGGPGRAGDGEELGGLWSLYPYMRRVAVQGSVTTIESLLR